MLERSRAGGMAGAPGGPPDIPQDVQDQLLRYWKEKHYATWPDIPIPALGGLTPRQAASGTAKARRDLDVLLKDFANGEARLPPGQRHDVGRLRVELGLDR